MDYRNSWERIVGWGVSFLCGVINPFTRVMKDLRVPLKQNQKTFRLRSQWVLGNGIHKLTYSGAAHMVLIDADLLLLQLGNRDASGAVTNLWSKEKHHLKGIVRFLDPGRYNLMLQPCSDKGPLERRRISRTIRSNYLKVPRTPV